MDLDQLKNQVSNISLYDIKAGFRKAQNAVMNYTEMEARVREATNNEPWGASSSLMQEIANGTFNYATLNEIMPMIYKRFTEKAAEEWRQIYKALQLLEFLIKNGSERVIDDARSHLSLLKMLRQFHYIDQNGKDQGINVRNRAKELAELLSDVDRIRQERKKARQTRNKYTGSEGGMGLGGGMTGGSGRYGGFGNEMAGGADASYGGYSGGVYGDGGGFGGNDNEWASSSTRNDRYKEYDEYDEGAVAAPGRRKQDLGSTGSRRTAAQAEPPKPKEPEVDLFDFGNDDIISAPPGSHGNQQAQSTSFGLIQPSAGAGADDDDFDDFQSAAAQPGQSAVSPPPQPQSMSFTSPTKTQFVAPTPMAPPPSQPQQNMASTGVNYSAFSIAPPPAPAQSMQPTSPQPMQPANQPKPTGFQQATPNYFGSIQIQSPPGTPGAPAANASAPAAAKPAAKSGAGGDPFANLSIGGGKKATGSTSKGPSMADMAKQKTSAGIWGAPAPQQQSSNSGNMGDLI